RPHLGSMLASLWGSYAVFLASRIPNVQVSDPINPERLLRRLVEWPYGSALPPAGSRDALAADVGRGRPLQRGGFGSTAQLRDRRSTPERAGRPPSRTRRSALARRPDRPHTADAGLQRALPARLRPRRHLDAERGREASGQGGTDAPGPRSRGVRRARLGLV